MFQRAEIVVGVTVRMNAIPIPFDGAVFVFVHIGKEFRSAPDVSGADRETVVLAPVYVAYPVSN